MSLFTIRGIITAETARNIPPDVTELVIDSPGGDIGSTLLIIDQLGKTDIRVMRINQATSASALLVIAVKATRKILQKGIPLKFHRGIAHLEMSDIDLNTGLINGDLLITLRRYTRLLISRLTIQNILKDPKKAAEFYGSNWLEIDSNEALKFGLVTEISED